MKITLCKNKREKLNLQEYITDKKRIDYIDVARGIAIVLMIVGHVLEQGRNRTFIFSFHMPLFIIISGMFFKQKDIKSFIINIIKGLIAPYVISIFCIDMIEYFVIKGEHDILSFIIGYIKQIGLSYSFLKSNTEIKSLGVLWFMPFLAMIRIIFML